jgi:hypothetical protein
MSPLQIKVDLNEKQKGSGRLQGWFWAKMELDSGKCQKHSQE